MTPRDRLLGLTVIVLWGLNFLAIRVGLDHFPPFFFAALRFLIIAIPVVIFVPRPQVPLRWLLLYGFGFGFGQFVFLFWAMHSGMPTGLASLVLQSSAPFTVLLGAFLLREKLSVWQVSGIAVAVGGMSLIGWDRSHHAALLPVVLTLLGGLSWAFGNLGSRLAAANTVGEPAPMRLMLWMSVVEGPTVGWHALGTAFSADAWPSLVGLAYIILLGTIAGSGLWTMLMGRYPAGMVAPLSLLVPVVGIGASWLFLHEDPSPLSLVGAVIVIAGPHHRRDSASDDALCQTRAVGTGLSITARGKLAMRAAAAASWASQKAGRGKGSMIGGLIALKIDPTLMTQLGPLATLGDVATQADGANMDAGIVAALAARTDATLAALEVDELHVPHVADAVNPEVIVLLNLSRDQLDRVGEINMIERKLRACVNAHPNAVIVANCDDVLVTSVAYDATNVVWVAAGGGWAGDSVSCPRTGEPIVWEGKHWRSTGSDFARPEPTWWLDDDNLYGPDGLKIPMTLTLPGKANRGNAAQAVAAAAALGADPVGAVAAASTVQEVAGRYSTVEVGPHSVHMLLAKNPAGWQEALSMIDPTVDGLVIAVNGQVPDGEDLSWLWDVKFEHFEGVKVVAAGERGTDLAVRLTYAGVEHTLDPDPLRAIASCPPGRVEVLANYTAFRDLNTAIAKESRNV
eukprot:gene22918-27479_t